MVHRWMLWPMWGAHTQFLPRWLVGWGAARAVVPVVMSMVAASAAARVFLVVVFTGVVFLVESVFIDTHYCSENVVVSQIAKKSRPPTMSKLLAAHSLFQLLCCLKNVKLLLKFIHIHILQRDNSRIHRVMVQWRRVAVCIPPANCPSVNIVIITEDHIIKTVP